MYEHKKEQNAITAVQTQKESTNNNWISFTYTGNETMKLAKSFKKINRNINIGFKTDNKVNNLSNNIENYNKFEKRVYQLSCNNCNKLYRGFDSRYFQF